MAAQSLTAADLAAIDTQLAATDQLLERNYPGDDGTRQPVHTVYVPADRFTPSFAAEWGEQALTTAEAHGGLEKLGTLLGQEPELAAAVAARVGDKLRTEPIEDLRLDFEDGFGDRGDEAEDVAAVSAANAVAAAVSAGTAPPFIGIRFKCFEAPTRVRGLKTLDLFVSTLAQAGELPAGLILTLPKVTTVAQVQAMDFALSRLEEVHGLPAGRLRFEVQVETPQLILGPEGTSPVAQLPHVVPGRISALHYGTYDYSASLQISAEYQSMEHPVADFAKEVMQLAVAGTGIRLSDGSTNIIPVGDAVEDAWKLHGRLVRRSLERGYYQGWDLHAAQLPSRFAATYAFYREGLPAAAARLRNYVERTEGGVMDEPATARALAAFVLRGVQCGAVGTEEVQGLAGVELSQLTALAHPRLAHSTSK
ncbi:aldolase [Pseudarthrobacter psychrotolerans]|uniref:Aldolase n=1 Tax=Pseudarthrobacter psychrotolerans TaxID=2697569 RepID=A0A6P1NIQ6_9MICC|nr:aldolase [Pseudarthrobacter psychrotolerans]QHK20505.1 aldolase [Pseudarthrobacter psychrotolerans]